MHFAEFMGGCPSADVDIEDRQGKTTVCEISLLSVVPLSNGLILWLVPGLKRDSVSFKSSVTVKLKCICLK